MHTKRPPNVDANPAHSRRDFLQAGVGAAGVLGLGPWVQPAYAQGGSHQHYVLVHFEGGWDVLLGLDPRDPRRFNRANLANTLIQPGYELLDAPGRSTDIVRTGSGLEFGPFMGDLVTHADQLVVVRGMSMGTQSHSAGCARFLDGAEERRVVPGHGRSIQPELCEPGMSVPPAMGQRAVQVTDSDRRTMLRAHPRLAEHYGVRADASHGSPEAQGALASLALRNGHAKVVAITANTESLDMHGPEWSSRQGPVQERGFNVIARMVEDLSSTEYGHTGSSWLDHTTIIAWSEFARSARLNREGGRDHSDMGAALLVGGGLRGGRAIGASSDVAMRPTPVDLQTGRPRPDGDHIRWEHITSALLQREGTDLAVAGIGVRPLAPLLT